MGKKILRYQLDPANPPPRTAKKKAEITALHARPDSAIDTGEIPELAEEFWKSAARNPFYKPTKTVTTVRVDSDVVAWLKSKGKGYQTRLNLILREAMLKEVSKT